MQHLELELRVLADAILVERNDVAVPYSKPGCIEVEGRLFLGSDTDSEIRRHFREIVEVLELILVVKDRNDIVPAGIQEIGYVLDVLRALEAIADHDQVLVHQTFILETLNKVQIVCG